MKKIDEIINNNLMKNMEIEKEIEKLIKLQEFHQEEVNRITNQLIEMMNLTTRPLNLFKDLNK